MLKTILIGISEYWLSISMEKSIYPSSKVLRSGIHIKNHGFRNSHLHRRWKKKFNKYDY